MAPTPAENDLIMFYGTLQRGETPYFKLNLAESLEYIEDCTFHGDLRDMGRHPACVAGKSIVHGEVYRIRDVAVVDTLDAYERYDPNDLEGSYYLRIRMQLLSPDIEVWTYIFNQDVSAHPVIESGHWVQHKRKRDGAA